jgi:hypothetical protein
VYQSAAQPETQTRELPELRQESNTRETEESDLRHVSFSPLGTSKVRQATTTQPPPTPVLARPASLSWLVTRSSPAGIPLHCRRCGSLGGLARTPLFLALALDAIEFILLFLLSQGGVCATAKARHLTLSTQEEGQHNTSAASSWTLTQSPLY